MTDSHADRLAAALSESSRLRERVAEQETLLKSMDHFAEVAERCEAKSNAYAAESVRLREQLEAVRRLCDEADQEFSKYNHLLTTGELRAILEAK